MSKHAASSPGAPCWVELFTSDPDRTVPFYGELFGWTPEYMGEQYGGYINLRKDGEMLAGCMRNDGTSGAPDSWSVYLASDDAETTVKAAAASGGQVVVPTMGVMAAGRTAGPNTLKSQGNGWNTTPTRTASPARRNWP